MNLENIPLSDNVGDQRPGVIKQIMRVMVKMMGRRLNSDIAPPKQTFKPWVAGESAGWEPEEAPPIIYDPFSKQYHDLRQYRPK